ncbi:MAG: zinc-binding alcohol dehydrogenase family protein [Ancalomicrobiaceae bacterium]|nr:zinc-binding alcohol dehydrogenase family protein [Ancalomicrobiaceae bacterium]
MRAIGFAHPGPIEAADALIAVDLPTPELGSHDLLVRVRAVSVNPVDVKVRAKSQPPAGTARILGYDAAGIVEAVGADVTLFRPGDAVFYAGAINRPGSNAELQAVDERVVGRKPQSLGFAAAAALPLTAITAWELLFDRLDVRSRGATADNSLLVVGGAGGVGSILTQIARRLTDLTVIATASRPETIAWAKDMGAHYVVDHRRPLDEALAEIGVPEVSYVAALTGTDSYLPTLPKIITPQGAIAVIDDPESLDVVPFKLKSIALTWEMMFTRSLFATPDMIEQHRLLDQVADLVDKGILRTTLTRTLKGLSVETLREAHAALESGRSIGKLVIEL